MGRVILFLKRLFCNHYYNLLEVQKCFVYGKLQHTVEIYYCVKCGKSKTVKKSKKNDT